MSTFEKALSEWTAVSLPKLQQELDSQGEQIQQSQSATLESRKLLASNTKEFKKLSDDLKQKEFKNLLKQYQREVDHLTQRAQLGEQAFFHVYSAIGELPDPKPLLEASLDSVIASQEVQQLREEQQQLQAEVLKYADYEQLKGKLLRLEQKSAETLTNRLKLQEEELSAQYREKEAQWLQKEEDWNKQLDELNSNVKELKTQQKVDKLKLQNQRIALGEDADMELDADAVTTTTTTSDSDHELQSLKKEVQLKESRLVQLESRNAELSRELTNAKSEAKAQEVKLAQELKLSELESENASLVAQLEHLKSSNDAGQRLQSTKVSSLTRELNSMGVELKTLKDKLVHYKDYDEVKKELNTLRTIAFGVGEDSDDEAKDGHASDDDDASGDDATKHGEDVVDDHPSTTTQLDEILVHRNKKLTADIVELRSKQSLMDSQIKQLEQELKLSKLEQSKLSQLNTQLEADLSQLDQASSSSKYDTMSMISGVTRNTTSRANPGGRRLSPASSIAGGVIQEEHTESSASVLPIITSQRDRFRARNTELETQLKKQSSQILELRSEISKLKKENATLFEKTRYLSSFQGSVRRNNGTGGEGSADMEAQLSYEESLHPLAKFRQREQERVASRLSPLERIFLSFAKAILANKTSRMLFLGYCVGLHGLVMMMSIYVMSLHGSLTPDVGVVQRHANMGSST